MRDPVNSYKAEASASESELNTIKVVSLRTGLPLDTLRAWERRYGFPKPERRPGSNRRLYSAADILRLVGIQRALGRGYRVGDVIAKTLVELDQLTAGAGAAPLSEPARAAATPIEELIELLVTDRIPELETALRRSSGSLGPRRFVTEVAHPFAVQVGAAWAESRLSIGHEHLATECLVTQLRTMLATYADIECRPLVLLTTLPGEPHTLPLQMVALYLVALGAKPRLLGGSTPPVEIAATAHGLGADVVGLTVTPTSDPKDAKKHLKVLSKALASRVPIWIGGAGAAPVAPKDERARVVPSWAAVDEVLSEWRERPAARSST